MRKTLFSLGLIWGACILVYANSFHASFHLDDWSSIQHNPLIQRFDISGLWKRMPLRILGNITFALSYKWSGLNVFGYHIFNLIIHAGAGCFSFFFLRTVLIAGGRKNEVHLLALLGALIFAVHPIQTQAVTYIVQRLASLAAFFYLGSMTFYASARMLQTAEEKKTREGLELFWPRHGGWGFVPFLRKKMQPPSL